MKAYELSAVATKVAQYVKPTETEKIMYALEQAQGCSAKPLKKSRSVLIVKIERKSRPSVHYEACLTWVKCNEKGEALTETGRKMTAKHVELAWK